jgi:phosphonopyruvate decarboxylase
MIEARSFVEAARQTGFQTYTGVPCSFLTPFINYVIEDESLNYISSANEGDAVASAAGAVIGGQRAIAMMQNSGLGNAVSPITSLTYIFKIPILLIITHRGAPDVKDEPQHELMGAITTDILDTMKVPWEIFPDDESSIEDVLQRAVTYMDNERKPYALIMKKGTVAPYVLKKTMSFSKKADSSDKDFVDNTNEEITRHKALQMIIDNTSIEDSVVIATTGFTGRELYALEDRINHFYMVGSMGCATSLSLGLSLARPELNVITVDGDGAALMRMGNFATVGAYGKSNFNHILLDNGVHDSTGGQQTVSTGVNFSAIANACGYSECHTGNPEMVIDNLLVKRITNGPGFAYIKTKPGTLEDLPRPKITPENVLTRLMTHIGTAHFT